MIYHMGVYVSTAPSDFTARINDVITFPADQMMMSSIVTILDDVIVEEDEVFHLTLTVPPGALSRVRVTEGETTITIRDTDSECDGREGGREEGSEGGREGGRGREGEGGRGERDVGRDGGRGREGEGGREGERDVGRDGGRGREGGGGRGRGM